MDISYLVGLRKDVRVEDNSFVTNFGTFDMKRFFDLGTRMKESLLSADSTEDDLVAFVLEDNEILGLQTFNKFWKVLNRSAFITYTLISSDKKLATIAPLGMGFSFNPKATVDDKPYQLSRFAILRTFKGLNLLECPKGWSQIDIFDVRLFTVLFHLQTPHTINELADESDLSREEIEAFLNMLNEAKALTEPGEDGAGLEDEDPALSHWELHDLYFHTRCQLGRHNNGWATTYRFQDKFPPLLQIKDPMSEDIIPLSKVEMPPSDSFFSVHESRKTRRDFADKEINVDELGTFLYHTARVKQKFDDDKGGVTFRPAQAGGALHSIEIYPLVSTCDGLEAGLYHYNPQEHHLEKLSLITQQCKHMLLLGRGMMLNQSEPQVQLLFASRFRRVQWKYESLAYSIILKDVGCLYQTMALVAEGMGLAGVALGGGHMDLFAAMSKLDCFAEGSVGSFMIGSRQLEKK